MPSRGGWWRCLGGGYHAGECGQGFGKGPEALWAGWQGGRPASRSLPVWELRSKAEEQVLVEELQGEHSGRLENKGGWIAALVIYFEEKWNVTQILQLFCLEAVFAKAQIQNAILSVDE